MLSLFSGVGGMDLGLERVGMEIVGQCEIDPYCRRVLAKHWPGCWRWDDVRTLTGEIVRVNAGEVDLICGGFPCQDISNAGKRAGIDGERSGLWSEFYRLICEVRPRYALVENVAALLVRGVDRVLGDLAHGGFDAEWSVLSACAMGAPHTRERVFIVAHAPSERFGERRWTEREDRIYPQGDVHQWRPEPRPPGVAYGVAHRMDRLACCGRAVVPQAAEYVGRLILEHADPRRRAPS